MLLIYPMLLFASLTYSPNYSKEVEVLESFDIEPSFLYDPIMNSMLKSNSTLKRHEMFLRTMRNAYYFIPTIKNILNEYKIPSSFLFLAMAESNFSNRAYSNKRASGLWQFMPQTAKIYNLKIDEYVDERRDLIKSTRAAAKHLLNLYDRFGKWYLAAIAYNCGEGTLERAIKRANSRNIAVLLDEHKKYIPRESRYYLRKIVALSLIGNNEKFIESNEYGHLLNRENAYTIANVKLPRGESLSRVAKLIALPLKKLKKLNRQLKYDFIPPYTRNYDIYIPYTKLSEFKRKYHPKSINKIYKIYIVKRGDNLYNIGKRYRVPYKVIMDFNKLKSNRLQIRQRLILPITEKTKKIKSKFYYTVKEGDSLESISKVYKISIRNLKAQNSLNSSLIRIGERLKIYE